MLAQDQFVLVEDQFLARAKQERGTHMWVGLDVADNWRVVRVHWWLPVSERQWRRQLAGLGCDGLAEYS
jgi:hypothetical protein